MYYARPGEAIQVGKRRETSAKKTSSLEKEIFLIEKKQAVEAAVKKIRKQTN
jgi:hypothetical protein